MTFRKPCWVATLRGDCTVNTFLLSSESNSKHNSNSNTYLHEVRWLQDLHAVLDHKPCLWHTKHYILQYLLQIHIIFDIWSAYELQ